MSERFLITGAGRGLGRALTEALVDDGHHVFATGRRLKDVQALAQDIAHKGGQIVPIEMDVSSDESVASAFEQVQSFSYRLDCLVNNAGVILETGLGFVDLPANMLSKTLDTNAIGAFRTTQAAIVLLENSTNPRIVNVSSGMGVMAGMGAGTTAYRASKAAMNVISLQAHFALSARGIRVLSVCPGWVRTDMGGDAAARSLTEGIAGILSAVATGPDGPSGQFMRDGTVIPW